MTHPIQVIFFDKFMLKLGAKIKDILNRHLNFSLILKLKGVRGNGGFIWNSLLRDSLLARFGKFTFI